MQVLGQVYSVLCDKEQKALYDEQGIVDNESDTISQDRNWDEYWRLMFKKVRLYKASSCIVYNPQTEVPLMPLSYLNFLLS